MKCLKCGHVNYNDNNICEGCHSKLPEYFQIPVIYQKEHCSVGAAALAMILEYFDIHVPYDLLAYIIVKDTGYGPGSNPAEMLKAARACGLECKGYKREPEELVRIKKPCIIHWDFNHFVVFKGYDQGIVFLNDPAVGPREITFEELDRYFTGVVLTFEKK